MRRVTVRRARAFFSAAALASLAPLSSLVQAAAAAGLSDRDISYDCFRTHQRSGFCTPAVNVVRAAFFQMASSSVSSLSIKAAVVYAPNEMQASEPKHVIHILSRDLLEAILCFVQRADFANLKSARITCKEWKELVDRRRDKLDCRIFKQEGTALLGYCQGRYNRVMAPRRYIELITVWQELEDLFSSFSMHALHGNGLDIYLSPSLTQFDDTFSDWLTHQALSIMNDGDRAHEITWASVWKLNMFRKKLDLRTRIYKELCVVMGVPPDPHMLHPTLPKGWTASETYIIVEDLRLGVHRSTVLVINLEKTEVKMIDLTGDRIHKAEFYESRCLNIWGDARWDDVHDFYTGPPYIPSIAYRDCWSYTLKEKVFVAPDCAQIANIFLRARDVV